jgi:hypothetical protein
MPHTGRNATRFLTVLAVLAVVRVTLPLAALAASGNKLPGLPRYDYVPTTGDGSGFYAATREFLASWGRLPLPLLIALVIATLAGTGILVRSWRRGKPAREWLIVLAAAGFALVVAAAVTQMNPPGAAVFGWPLVWSLPMLPYRALGFPLDPDIAFGFGLTLSLVANVVTVVATAFAGLYATGRRSLGLAAAALFAFWPLLVGLVGGTRAWGNGTWAVDAGLAMYTEPLSTALVTVALALLLSPRLTPMRIGLAGVALSLATTVKLTNALVGIAALALLAIRLDRTRVLPYLAGLLTFVPILVAYWPKGYAALFDDPNSWPRDPFSADYVIRNWSDSLLFGPRTLLVLVPLAVVGTLALRGRWPRLLLVAWVLGNAAFYSFYRVTPEHPRFLFASLAALFVLWIVGAATVIEFGRRHLRGGRYTLQSPRSTSR